MTSARSVRERGVAVVEFAIVAPLLALLLLAGAELGRAFFQYTILSYAVREGVRHASIAALTGTAQVVDVTGTVITQSRNLVVYGNIAGTGVPRLPALQVNQVTVANAGNNNVNVSANYPYQPMIGATLPMFGLGAPVDLTFTFQVAHTMRATGGY